MEIKVLTSSSAGNCAVIDDGHTKIMLDCGIPWKKIRQKLSFKTSEIAALCLTHQHNDHSMAIHDVARFGIDCWLSSETKAVLGLDGHRFHEFISLKQFSIGTWFIKAFPLVHDVSNYGFLMASIKGEKLAYITDTAYCKYRFIGLTHVLVEANYSLDILDEHIKSGVLPIEMKKRLLKTHMSLETCKGFLRANNLSKVQAIWLLHLSDQNSCGERFKKEVQEITGKPTYIAGGEPM